MSYVCKDKEEETGGFGFVLSNSLNFLRSSDSNRAVSHPSRDSTPESPSLRALEACVGCLFPGVEFWLSTPCLDICYSLLVDILSQSEKPLPKFLASPVFRSTCSDAGFPGTLSLLRPALCLLRAARSGARVDCPFSFLSIYAVSSFAQSTFLGLIPDLSEASFDSDPSASAAVFVFVNLNMSSGCPSAQVSSIVVITGA